MSRQRITYSCGHEGTEDLRGPHAARQRRLRWLEESASCPDCCRQARADARAATTKAAAEQASRDGLPMLTGSPKQIAWAQVIRKEILDHLRGFGGRLVKSLESRPDLSSLRDALAGFAAALADEPCERSHWSILADRIDDLLDAPADVRRFAPIARAVPRLLEQATARWWIDAREKTPQQLLFALAGGSA